MSWMINAQTFLYFIIFLTKQYFFLYVFNDAQNRIDVLSSFCVGTVAIMRTAVVQTWCCFYYGVSPFRVFQNGLPLEGWAF